VEPKKERHVEDVAADDGDDVVALQSSLGRGHKARRGPPLQRDAVEHRVGEKRAKQNDGSEIAIGDEMGERPGLDGDEERVLGPWP
jgi:hypothetical protein